MMYYLLWLINYKQEVDEDVQKEADFSKKSTPSEKVPLILQNLKKTYRNGKNALQGISFAIEVSSLVTENIEKHCIWFIRYILC